MFSTLLVEDNENFRQLLSDTLLKRFPAIDVEESNDGEDALCKMEYLRPDIIFMDIRLPGENGLELTRKIKQVYEYTVIVILTGHDLPEYRQRAFRNGADCFISKDSDTCMEDILARVEGAMVRKQRNES
ncbi:MAG: response regulator transcription factor [Pseudomonadota bacterium]|nr:response regulator transcription factor [Pseudomonadota bacterium]